MRRRRSCASPPAGRAPAFRSARPPPPLVAAQSRRVRPHRRPRRRQSPRPPRPTPRPSSSPEDRERCAGVGLVRGARLHRGRRRHGAGRARRRREALLAAELRGARSSRAAASAPTRSSRSANARAGELIGVSTLLARRCASPSTRRARTEGLVDPTLGARAPRGGIRPHLRARARARDVAVCADPAAIPVVAGGRARR